MKNRLIIVSVFVLFLGILAILNLQKTDSTTENVFLSTTTAISVETTNSTKTTKTTRKTSKKTTTKRIKINENKITEYLYQRVLEECWSEKDYQAIVNIVLKESGLNPNNVNKSSGACGLFQAHPCKKAIKQYPDYMENYKSQVNWGINYIKDRYKTPSNAWKFWQEHKWY